MDLDALRQTLTRCNQQHVLAFYDELPPDRQAGLRAQLAEIDWDALPDWVETYVVHEPEFHLPDDLAPADFYPLTPRDDDERALYEQAEARGWELLREGRVAAFTVAGGQGTRLGFDGPKGTFPIAPVTGKTLFQWFAESLLRFGERAGAAIRWYIMTSPMNDAPTRAFFADNDYFALDPANLRFFPQGTMPAFGFDGKLLLSDKGALAVSPDGHGGSLKALYRSGAIADMQQRGIEHISYFQVDNPLVSVVNPRFLGLHDLTGSDMSSRSLSKTGPFEKIGAFCRSGGRTLVIEYSDLPDELATQTDAAGRLRFLAGSPAIHVLRRDFVARLNNHGTFRLPFHRAVKKIPTIDAAGNPVKPGEPNGVKLETFVFDALPLANNPIIVEAEREDEFGPVKNATGIDSVESSRRLMQERFARWLEARGEAVPRDHRGELAVTLEISPRNAVTQEDFRRLELDPLQLSPGDAIELP